MAEQFVIIGAGQAAVQAVQSLRAEGLRRADSPWWATRPIRPISARLCPRPICWGSFARERLFLKADAFYREAAASCVLNTRVYGDRSRRQNRGR